MQEFEPTQDEIDNTNIREENVQEILSTPPKWLVSWGTTIVVFMLSILITIGWWIRYPDIVSAPVLLTTSQPPVKVMAKASGNLTRLLISDNEIVEEGQRLAVIKSTASADDIFELEHFLYSISYLSPDTLLELELPNKKNLGELQEGYSDFVQYLENYKLFLNQQTELKQIPYLQKEIEYIKELNQGWVEKDTILAKEIQLTTKNLNRQKEALAIGGVVPEKVEQIEAQLLQMQQQREDIKLQVLNNSIQINTLINNIVNIRQRTEEAGKGQYILAKESWNRLKSSVREWIEQYVLVASIDGRISFFDYWSAQQYVAANTDVFTIIPESKAIHGKVLLPVLGSGKVEVGQKVNIKLSAYPYKEYGIIKGKVNRISLIPKESRLIVDIELPEGLMTTYQKEISFRQQMQGTAEIITKERRLLQRFIESMLSGE